MFLVILTERLRFSGLQPTLTLLSEIFTALWDIVSSLIWYSICNSEGKGHVLQTLKQNSSSLPAHIDCASLTGFTQKYHLAEFFWQSQTDSVWDLSPLRLALLIFYKLFHLSPLNIQNFSTEVSISFVQRNVQVALAAWSVCRAQNNEGEFFSIFSINI